MFIALRGSECLGLSILVLPILVFHGAGVECHSFIVFSERERTFTFVNSRSRSLYMLSPVRLSVVCLSVTLVHPTQAVQIFRNISTALGTLAIH